ncbi:MAG: hypothetical protein HQL49_12320, partial [Gammaproteobacteria bacterium]|nr:hypothetical protein [Gammaproteobacteria bacterium]
MADHYLNAVTETLPQARILIVDDMATNRGLVKAVLGSVEFILLEAVSGEDALDKIATLKPDVILLD